MRVFRYLERSALHAKLVNGPSNILVTKKKEGRSALPGTNRPPPPQASATLQIRLGFVHFLESDDASLHSKVFFSEDKKGRGVSSSRDQPPSSASGIGYASIRLLKLFISWSATMHRRT